ncbi:MAG TPA: hypothetical protein VGE52_12685 [Pirellulales bacterium]
MTGVISAVGAFCVGASLAFPFVYGCLLQRYWLALAAGWVAMIGVAMAGGAAAEAAAKPQPGALFWSLFGGASLAVAVGVLRLLFGVWPNQIRLDAPESSAVLWALQAGSGWLVLIYPLVLFLLAMSFDAWTPAMEATPGGQILLTVSRAVGLYPFVFFACYGLAWVCWGFHWNWAAVLASVAPFGLLSLFFAWVVYASLEAA